MAKDPATLWYWADWYGGTVTMSRHLKGCYMDLLYAQFNSGRLSLAQVKTVLGGDYGAAWPLLQEKFIKDENDNWYNIKAEAEKIKRLKFTESRRKNLQTPICAPHMESHMVNANASSIKDGGLGETIKDSNLFRKPVIPTKNQVLEAIINAGGTKEMAKSFWLKHESTGWFTNGSPIKNYVAMAQRFVGNWKGKENETQSGAAPLKNVDELNGN